MTWILAASAAFDGAAAGSETRHGLEVELRRLRAGLRRLWEKLSRPWLKTWYLVLEWNSVVWALVDCHSMRFILGSSSFVFDR